MASGKNTASRAKSAAAARERVAAAQAEAKRKARRGKMIFRGILAVLTVGIVGTITAVVLASQASANIAGVTSFSGLSRNHVTTPVTYPQTPPVGGDHAPVWLNCGVYTAPVANENAVHSMEHGAVWITYQPGIGAGQIATLASDVHGKAYTVLSPYPTQPSPITVTAWGKQLNVDSATDARIAKFISKYMQGPQTPEPGAACTGGTGTPSGS